MRSEKVLVSLKPYLGDAVMVQPAVEALSEGGSEVWVQTSTSGAELLSAWVSRERRLPFPSGKSLTAIVREARKLRKHGFQTVVLANLSFRSALICRLAGIPRRIGHAVEGRGFLLTHRVRFDSSEFQASSVVDLLEPLGVKVASFRPHLAFPDSKLQARQLLSGATLGFHSGARDPWKRLPRETMFAVVEGLLANGHILAMFGGQEESGGAQILLDRFKTGLIDLTGRTTLGETVAGFSTLRASFGGDTGVMHLSAAGGCPTLQIFGSGRAARWGHGYPPHRVIEAPEGDLAKIAPKEILEAVLQMAG